MTPFERTAKWVAIIGGALAMALYFYVVFFYSPGG